jgi:hypothetical protein
MHNHRDSYCPIGQSFIAGIAIQRSVSMEVAQEVCNLRFPASICESYLKRSFSNEDDIKSATHVLKGASDLAGY